MPITDIEGRVTNPLLRKEQEARKVDEEKLREACKDFESLFVQQVLRSMRKTISKSDLFSGGAGGEIFESLFDQELSRNLANRGVFGLGKILYHQMIKKLKEDSRTK